MQCRYVLYNYVQLYCILYAETTMPIITGQPQKETSEKYDKRNDISNALLHTVNAEVVLLDMSIVYNIFIITYMCLNIK